MSYLIAFLIKHRSLIAISVLALLLVGTFKVYHAKLIDADLAVAAKQAEVTQLQVDLKVTNESLRVAKEMQAKAVQAMADLASTSREHSAKLEAARASIRRVGSADASSTKKSSPVIQEALRVLRESPR